jgi:hypothetical protein
MYHNGKLNPLAQGGELRDNCAEHSELFHKMEVVLTSLLLSTEEGFSAVDIYARSFYSDAIVQAARCLSVTVETWV